MSKIRQGTEDQASHYYDNIVLVRATLLRRAAAIMATVGVIIVGGGGGGGGVNVVGVARAILTDVKLTEVDWNVHAGILGDRECAQIFSPKACRTGGESMIAVVSQARKGWRARSEENWKKWEPRLGTERNWRMNVKVLGIMWCVINQAGRLFCGLEIFDKILRIKPGDPTLTKTNI